MAKCTKKEVVPIPPPVVVTLELTAVEASYLMDLTGCTTSGVKGNKKVGELYKLCGFDIYNALSVAGVESHIDFATVELEDSNDE